jgi:alpha-1,3/alpha-1,6-mannosyltransferase
MGKAGIERVKKEFSDVKMAERLDGIIDSMAGRERMGLLEIPLFFLTLAALCVDIGYYLALQNKAISEQLGRIPVPPFILTGLSLVNWVVYFAMGYAVGKNAQTEVLAQKKTR